MINISYLHQLIAAVCPIYGISIGNEADKSTWIISFAPDATPEQQLAAQSVIDAFDPNAVTIPDAWNAAKNFMGGKGYGAQQLATLIMLNLVYGSMDLKIQAVWAWFQQIISITANASTDFTDPPYTFEQILR